jgi:hypothetical protein
MLAQSVEEALAALDQPAEGAKADAPKQGANSR